MNDLLWPRYAAPADVIAIESVALAQRGLPESTYAVLTRAATLWPDRIAVSVLADAERWRQPTSRTFAELLADVHRGANVLRCSGTSRSDPVTLISPNCDELITATLAAQLAGIAAPINSGLSAAHISHLVGSRHSHLDAGGYSVDQNILKGNKMSLDETVDRLLEEESWRQVLSSLVVCFFARGIFSPETVSEALKVAGHDYSVDDLFEFGRKVHRLKYRFKEREGFKPESLRIPRRIFDTPSPRG